MDLRGLRYFVEVVRQNGFRRASDVLHVTQPAISRSISSLEEETGSQLLIREPKGIALTPEGEVLYRHATLILRQSDNLLSELRDLQSMAKGTLRVGLPHMTGATFFGSVISEFRRKYPGIQLLITEYGTNQLQSALVAGEIELAAAMLPIPDDWALTLPFGSDRLVLLCARNHVLAGKKRVNIGELSSEPFIGFSEDFKVNELIDQLCAKHGYRPNIVGRSGHLDLIVSMVVAGMGVALVPESAGRKIKSSRLSILPIADTGTSYGLALVRVKDAYLSKGGRAWIEVASKVIGFSIADAFIR
ncbi:LysR substrate-binding domain-containing protein [Paraburkholderia tropica]|uniref:LysR family transcriptional regulator n=1 Tax=Paraburkholderia tropica TaxID=92647 RepID=A0ABX5MDU5_9BURK|nr:LysR substrate-binding domain-containing protein [Paraburkholderia tropica]PXX05885.1 LysR family transcriptional regulator [Paraburkholderia tropica]PZW70927.1 LysR family transcriptional regulator [Paraburkholderia tropica]